MEETVPETPELAGFAGISLLDEAGEAPAAEQKTLLSYCNHIAARPYPATGEDTPLTRQLAFRHQFFATVIQQPECATLLSQTKEDFEGLYRLESYVGLLYETGGSEALTRLPHALHPAVLGVIAGSDMAQKVAMVANVLGYGTPEPELFQQIHTKIAYNELCAECALTVADEATQRNQQSELFDHALIGGFRIAETFIERSAPLAGAEIYTRMFWYMLEWLGHEAAEKKLAPLQDFATPLEERIHRFIRGVSADYLNMFVDDVRAYMAQKTGEEGAEFALDNDTPTDNFFERNKDTEMQVHEMEDGEREVEAQDMSQDMSQELNSLVLDAGKTIVDFLKNMKLEGPDQSQDVGVGNGSQSGAGGADGDEEEKKQKEEESFWVYTNSYQKEEMKTSQIITALKHGQNIRFASDAQMKKFNETTKGKYTKLVGSHEQRVNAEQKTKNHHSQMIEALFDDQIRDGNEDKKRDFKVEQQEMLQQQQQVAREGGGKGAAGMQAQMQQAKSELDNQAAKPQKSSGRSQRRQEKREERKEQRAQRQTARSERRERRQDTQRVEAKEAEHLELLKLSEEEKAKHAEKDKERDKRKEDRRSNSPKKIIDTDGDGVDDRLQTPKDRRSSRSQKNEPGGEILSPRERSSSRSGGLMTDVKEVSASSSRSEYAAQERAKQAQQQR